MSQLTDNQTVNLGLFARLKQNSFIILLMSSLSAHSIYIIFAAFYFGAYLALIQYFPPAKPKAYLLMIGGMLVSNFAFALFALLFHRIYNVARYQKPKSPTIAILKDYWKFISTPKNIALGLPIILIMATFSFIYVQFKNHIPHVIPYSWDQAFYNLDKVIHFGKSPWEWLHPVFSSNPYFVGALNFNYNMWFITMWLIIISYALMTKNPILRTRFFIAFFLIWTIGGSLMATLLSSAGPAFYSRLDLGADPYAPLMAYLRHVNELYPVWALNLQDTMWQAYNGHGIDVGISAMPSMHNATSLLFAIAAFQISKRVGYIVSTHTFLIFLGSIYLAWHYAIDAYVSWGLTITIWYISGYIARWWHTRPQAQQFDRISANKNTGI